MLLCFFFSKYLKYSPNLFGKSEAYRKYDFQIEYIVYLNLEMPKYITKCTTRMYIYIYIKCIFKLNVHFPSMQNVIYCILRIFFNKIK